MERGWLFWGFLGFMAFMSASVATEGWWDGSAATPAAKNVSADLTYQVGSIASNTPQPEPVIKAAPAEASGVKAQAIPGEELIRTTGFFSLSQTAAIIVSIAVLLVVILAVVAMTNNRGTTYVDRDEL